MKTKIALIAIVAALAVSTGCSRFLMPSSAQIRALAADTNTVYLRVNSVYGNLEMRRNIAAPQP